MNRFYQEYWAVLVDLDGELHITSFPTEEKAQARLREVESNSPELDVWMQHGAWLEKKYIGFVPDMRNMGCIPGVN